MSETYYVTGAVGFVGKAFVNYITAQDNHVVVIVRNAEKALRIWGDSVSIVEADLEHIMDIRVEDIEGYAPGGIFVHFAWAGTSGELRASEGVQLRNIQNTCNAVRKAAELGCSRFINAGSVMEYEAMETIGQDGQKPGCNMIYSAAKLTADYMGKTVAAAVGIEFINLIISNIYGPGEVSARFLNSILRKMLCNEEIRLTECTQMYDFIYIEDAVRAMEVVSRKGAAFESYYIGSPVPKVLKEFIYEMKETVSSSSDLLFGAIHGAGVSLSYREFDCSKLLKLGCHAMVSFREGILRTKEWICKNHLQRA